MSANTPSPLERYDALAAAGDIEADPEQRRVAARLARLKEELDNRRFATKRSALGWLFARGESSREVKGVYIHGAVGRGKTMLMDLFYEAAPDLPKRRVHFHEFMAETHERIHVWRQRTRDDNGEGGDPIAPAADEIAREARLLCFDEFHVRDIADAMILGRLFTRLMRHKVAIVATSNDAPEELYRDGLNRALFLPFIDLLRARMDVMYLDARIDYRLEKLTGQKVYFQPLGQQARRGVEALWRSVADGGGEPAQLRNKGRTIAVPEAKNGAARFTFADLCEAPLAAGDYLKIARAYPTLVVEEIPVLGPHKRNEARRFIDLVDTLYDNHVRLIASAAAEPAALYPEGAGAENFMRTASRLIEMRSRPYLEEAAAARGEG